MPGPLPYVTYLQISLQQRQGSWLVWIIGTISLMLSFYVIYLGTKVFMRFVWGAMVLTWVMLAVYAGVLLSVGSLAPSSGAARLRNFGGKKTVVDGPFVESKELVGGFVVLELDSREQAIEWAGRYADVLGEIELDIRPVEGISTFGR